MAFKTLPGQASGKTPLMNVPQQPGQPNVNPVVSAELQKKHIGTMGKSASAPGQLKKQMGLGNASSLVRQSDPEDGKPMADGKVDALRAAAKRMSTMPQPALKYRKAPRPKPVPSIVKPKVGEY